MIHLPFGSPCANRRGLVLAACAVAFLSACSPPRIEAPPPAPQIAPPPVVEVSSLSVPISIGLDGLRDEIVKSLPTPLSEGKQVKKAALNVGSRLLSAPINVEFRHKVLLEALDLSVVGNRFVATATVDLSIGSTFNNPLANLGLASCGENEPMARLQLSLPGLLSWGADGKLALRQEQWSMKWLSPCNLTAFKIRLDDILDLPFLRDRVMGAVAGQLAQLPAELALRPVVEKAWQQIAAPQQVMPGTWLVLRPEAIGFSGLSGSGKQMTTIVHIRARPSIISSGAAPALPVPPLPKIEQSAGDGGFHLALEGEISLQRADSILSETLSKTTFKAGGKEILIRRARAYGSGARAVIGLTFEKPFIGEVHLIGIPRYDTSTNILTFDSLNFSLSSRNFLLKSADWLMHDSFRDLIQRNARVRMDDYLPSLEKQLRDLRIDAGHRVLLTGGVDRIRPRAIYITDQAIKAYVVADGKLAVSIGQ